MRIDQLPIAASVVNANTLPVNVGGITEQVTIGNLVNAIRDDVYGAPLTAATASAMTDQTKIYVYTGTTTSALTNGHWYYYSNGWKDGGVYNSTAVQTDTTLTLSGVPADGKATGDAIAATNANVATNATGISTNAADIDALEIAIAPAFDAAVAYDAGQYVWQAGAPYRFTAAHAAGEWTGTDAELVNIGNELFTLHNLLGLISEKSVNLWYNGDVAMTSEEYFVQYRLKNPLPAGTYTLSCVATASATTPANSTIRFSRGTNPAALPSSSFITNVTIAHDGTRHSVTFALTETAYSVRFMGGTSTSGSNAVAGATFEDIQIESGITATEYVEPMTAVDFLARAGLASVTAEVETLSPLKDTAFMYRGYLEAGTNLDTLYSECGMYVWTGATNPTSLPSGFDGAGVLLCFGVDLTAFPVQIVVKNVYNKEMYYRYKAEDAWSPWYMVASSQRIAVDCYMTKDDARALRYTPKDFGRIINTTLSSYGYCHLGPGEYDIYQPIVMPEGTTLTGCGPKTVLRFVRDSASATMLSMNKRCMVRDLTLVGLASGTLTPTDTIGTRYGIRLANIESTEGDEQNAQGVISGVEISDFDGAGILLANTGTPVDKGLAISDCYIHRNTVGIYISQNSEFNKVENCTITYNRWGVLNRGGNNVFSNCGIDKNYIGVQIDNDLGSNGGHGSITGCTINHSGANNDGYGIIVRGTGRMLIANCNLYYSSARFENTDGNIVTGCGFGQSANVEIEGGYCTMLNGCIFYNTSSTITLTNSTRAKVVNCFTRAGWDATVVTNTTASLTSAAPETDGEGE